MSFATEVVKDGIGRCVRVDFSTDAFATTSLRVGTLAGLLDGTNHYSARVVEVGNVRRGFGVNRIAAGGTTDLVLDNADGALDAWAGQSSMSAQAALRVRIYLCLYTPGAAPATFTSKLLGEFVLTTWVRRTNTTLTFALGDDIMGSVSQQCLLPTLAGWEAVGTTATNPLKNGFGRPQSLVDDGTTPVQLAFGEDWVEAFPHLIPLGTVDAAYQNKVIVPVCCTDDTGAGSSNDVTNLRILWLDPNAGVAPRLVDVPRTVWDDQTQANTAVWSVERSPTITRDGKNFKVIYLVVRADLGVLNLNNNWLTGYSQLASDSGGYSPSYDSPQFSLEWQGGYPASAIYKMRGYASNNPETPQYASHAAGVLAWYVKGYPLSARTQTSSPVQHPCDVVKDLVSHYSANTAITIDTAQHARVRAGISNAACAGVVQAWTERANNASDTVAPPSLRQTITKLCQSGDFDVFINWDGEFSFSSDVRDAYWVENQAFYLAIPETQFSGLVEWIPSTGERHAPFNRLYFSGGKAYAAEGLDVPFQGPWDFEVGSVGIALTDRIVEATLEQGWRPWRQQAFAPWSFRQLDTTARPKVRFITAIHGLQLELGDFFRLTWTRGDVADTAGNVYSASAFQLEAIVFAPSGDEVELEAVWVGDYDTSRQYLLDDETLLVRSKSGGSSTAAVTAASTTVNFTGTIDLGTMGVEAGDILVLRDSTQAEDVFTLNAAFLIASVTDADTLELVTAPTASNASLLNADWSIVRGATTYPTAVSDPTNYPDGGDMYGKATNVDGEYSNAAGGNQLFSG